LDKHMAQRQPEGKNLSHVRHYFNCISMTANINSLQSEK
jgi:hypothetical protein